ncbi:MAG: hypothetical protein ACXVAF_14085 [Vulcanimicrobiaceae bacterium]
MQIYVQFFTLKFLAEPLCDKPLAVQEQSMRPIGANASNAPFPIASSILRSAISATMSMA